MRKKKQNVIILSFFLDIIIEVFSLHFDLFCKTYFYIKLENGQIYS